MKKNNGKPIYVELWLKDAETNENYWWNRPKCIVEGCESYALSFRNICWLHMSDNEREKLREEVLKKNKEMGELTGLNLKGIDLKEENFKGAGFAFTNLEEADLGGTNFEGAFLLQVNFNGADLRWANLKGANFLGVKLERAYLVMANLEGAKLHESNLKGAQLNAANLRGADLIKSKVGKILMLIEREEGLKIKKFFREYKKNGRRIVSIPISSEEECLYKPIRYWESTDFTNIQYNPHTRIYIFPLAMIKWFLLWNWSRIEKYVKNRYIEFTKKRKGHYLAKNPKYWFYSITMLWFIKDYFKHKFQLKRIRNFVDEQRVFIRESTEKKLRIPSKFVCLFSIFSFIKRFFLWVCENILGFMDPKRPGIARYKRTKLYRIDTTDLDSSKNPQLIRDIHYQQFLDAFKNRRPKWFYRPAYFLWGLTSFFGESLLLWLLWAGVIIMLFAALFYYTNCCFYVSLIPLQKMEISYFTDAVYLSSIAFTSLGLGNYEPANSLAKWLIIAEVMLGFIMLGSLVSFFANKFVRRD